MVREPEEFHLWIARDPMTTAVALRPVTVSGTAHRHQWAGVTDVTAGPAADRAWVERQTNLLTGIALAGALASYGMGVHWWLALPAAAIVVVLIRRATAWVACPGTVVAPDLDRQPHLHRVLVTRPERAAFEQLTVLAERIGRILPALDGLIDRREAGELLAQALWDGAELLTRRQELRAVRYDLTWFDGDESYQPDRAVHQDQRDRTGRLWADIDAELGRLTACLTDVATTGEQCARDRGSASGQRPADGTVAVLAAYRELTDLFGSGPR
ncbi:MAG TPA: hypothetical protein VGD43_01360 [Micromonospora sp.]